MYNDPLNLLFNLLLKVTSTFDPDMGKIHFKKLDGLLNNFNKVVIGMVHCNMDIDLIDSGPDAKALIFYVMDYITKSQLPTHVTYTILEYAIHKLELVPNHDTDSMLKAKRLLWKCANALIAKQELSA